MTVCPSCKSHDLERVRSTGSMRFVTNFIPMVKWHCRVCQHEFLRKSDNVFTGRRVVAWLLLLCSGFFIWLTQVDTSSLRSNEVSNTSGQATLEAPQPSATAASSTDDVGTPSTSANRGTQADQGAKSRDLKQYLPDSQLPSNAPDLSLSFIGVIESPIAGISKPIATADVPKVISGIADDGPNELVAIRIQLNRALERNASDQAELERQRTNAQELEAEVERMAADNNALSAQVTELTQQLETNQVNMEKRLSTATLEIDSIEDQLRQLQQDKETYLVEIEDLKTAAQAVKAQYETADAKVVDLQQQNTELTQRSQSLVEENGALKLQANELQQALTSARARADEAIEATNKAKEATNKAEQLAARTQQALEALRVAQVSRPIDQSEPVIDGDVDIVTDTGADIVSSAVTLENNSNDAAVANNAAAPEEEPVAEPVANTDVAKAQIANAVENWRSKWQARDIEGYLAAYSDQFDSGNGPGIDLAQWRDKRRYIINRATELEISVSDLVSARVRNDRYVVRFVQKYHSATYEDEVIKQLVFVMENGGWKIAREESI